MTNFIATVARTVTASLLLMILALSSAAPASAIDSFFDIFTEIPVTGPPYPTEPLITIIGENVVGSFQPQQECQDEIAAVRLNGLPPGTPIIAGLHGGGAGGLPPSIDSFFDVFIDMDFTVPTSGQLRITRDIQVVPPSASRRAPGCSSFRSTRWPHPVPPPRSSTFSSTLKLARAPAPHSDASSRTTCAAGRPVRVSAIR